MHVLVLVECLILYIYVLIVVSLCLSDVVELSTKKNEEPLNADNHPAAAATGSPSPRSLLVPLPATGEEIALKQLRKSLLPSMSHVLPPTDRRSTLVEANFRLSILTAEMKATRSERALGDTETRLVESMARPFVVDTKDNMACAVFGKELGLKVGGWSRSKASLLLNVLCLAGFMMVFLGWINVLQWGFILLGSLMTLPNIFINVIAVLNVPLVKLLALRFETVYSLYNLASFSVGFLMRFYRDPVMVFSLITWLITAISVLFCDALSNGHRKSVVVRGVSAGIIWMIAVEAALYFNWFQFEEEISFSVGAMTWTADSLMSSGAATVMVFWAKMMKAAIVHPEEFTVLMNRLVSRKVSTVDAALIMSVFDMKMEEVKKVSDFIARSKQTKKK